MPICITCSTPVKNLYTTYSKADDRSLGKGVRLTQCPNCKRFADKYVEHDKVVLFIDLVLIKPQVYRHLLFNRLGRADNKLDPSILRLGTLLVLFDVYITWARIEQSNASSAAGDGGDGPWWALSEAPILVQYLFFLTMNVLATVAQHAVIRLLASLIFARLDRHQEQAKSEEGTQAARASPSAISTALLISSCSKLFPILLVIWPSATSESADAGSSTLSGGLGRAFSSNAANYVGYAVLFNNVEALLILLDCGYGIATTLALAGLMCRWVVESWALELAGLRSTSSSGAVSDGISLLNGWFSTG